MAGLVLVFGAALTGVAWLLNRWIRSNLELQAEKTELARELIEALASLERRVEERTVALRHALADKELLLREMNHRVKNSLQLVASMLSLREHLVSDPTARAHLAESEPKRNGSPESTNIFIRRMRLERSNSATICAIYAPTSADRSATLRAERSSLKRPPSSCRSIRQFPWP